MNRTGGAGAWCLETLCFPADTNHSLLAHIARGAYAVWDLARNNATGIYIDHVDLTRADPAQQDWAQGSAEYTGLGMMVECVAAALGWIPLATAQQRVLQSLRSLNGCGA